MKITITNTLHAQSNITTAKVSSASFPFPRLLRKARIGEGGSSACEGEGRCGRDKLCDRRGLGHGYALLGWIIGVHRTSFGFLRSADSS